MDSRLQDSSITSRPTTDLTLLNKPSESLRLLNTGAVEYSIDDFIRT